MEKKRELSEITLKAKLMKLEPKLELANQYDEYVNNKPQIPQQEPEPEQIMYIPKPVNLKKKIIYKEIEEQEEEEIVYINKIHLNIKNHWIEFYINHVLNNYI